MQRPDDGLVMGNEQDSGIAVVYGCFQEGDDYILSIFSSESLRAKLISQECAYPLARWRYNLKSTISLSDACADVSSRCKRNERAKQAHSLYIKC